MTQRNGRAGRTATLSRDTRPARRPTWPMVLRAWLPRGPGEAAVVAARLIAVAGLSIDAYVHLDLASTYSEAQAVISEGVLFRGEAALALLAGLTLLMYERRRAFVLGFAVSSSAFTVMLVSRYVDLGPIGPFPDLYDPVWFPEKLWAAGGEAAAAAACIAGILILSIGMRRRRGTGQQRGHPGGGAAGGSAPGDERGRDDRGAALTGLAAAFMLVAACGSSGGNTASSGASSKAAPAAVVSVRHLSGIGAVLATSSGMTIYTPKTPAEVNGNIKCTGSCLSFWFPVTTSSAKLRSSSLPGKLGTIHLSNGTTQLTYSGRPLYTFRLDTAAGQAHGNNYSDSFNGVKFTWQIVTPSGKAAGAGSPAPTPSYSTGGGY